MMQPFVAYIASGRIVLYGSVMDTDLALQSGPGMTFLSSDASARGKTHYVLAGAVVSRPACPISAAVVGRVVTLTGVPVGAAYAITGDAELDGVADDATLALTFGAAGTYSLFVDCFPAQDFTQGFTLA